MENHFELVELTTVFLSALVCGLILLRLRQPPLVGYIVAGVVLGPSFLELVSNKEAVRFFAELGAMLLMFVIGMELSLRSFRRLYKLTLGVVAVQIASGLTVAFVIGWLFGWGIKGSVIIGFAIALSSTAVGVNMLEDVGELRTTIGRLAVGILIAQDLAVVPMFVIVENIGGEAGADPLLFVRVVGALGFLAWLVPFMSAKKRLSLPFAEWVPHESGVTVLAGLTFCFLLATLSGLLGLTTAFGSFVAGLIIGNSQQRSQFFHATVPVRDVLLMLFFLSIGLSIDFGYVAQHIPELILLVLFIFILKTAGNLLILRAFNQSWVRSIRTASVLAQMGEFSLILGATGLSAGALSFEGYRMLVTVIALTLVASPLWLSSAREISKARYMLYLIAIPNKIFEAFSSRMRAGDKA